MDPYPMRKKSKIDKIKPFLNYTRVIRLNLVTVENTNLIYNQKV